MGTRFGLLLKLGAGYMFGTRAGREQYERIRLAASEIRRFPVIARPLDNAGGKVSNMVRAQDERVTDRVTDTVREHLFGTPATLREVDLRSRGEGPNSH